MQRYESHHSLSSDEGLEKESLDKELRNSEAELQDDLPVNAISLEVKWLVKHLRFQL